MGTFVILQQMVVIALLVCTGIYLQKRDILDDHTAGRLSAIVVDIANPALILSTAFSGEIEATRRQLLAAGAVSVVFYACLCLLGALAPRLFPVPREERKFYNLMMIYTNIGFIGIPLGRAVLGGSGMLCVIMCNVMFGLLFYTHGVTVLGKTSGHMEWRSVFSSGTVASLLTLALLWFDVPLPEVLTSTVAYIGNATVFLSMALLGASLAKNSIKSCFREKGLWCYVAVRMLLVPFLVLFSLRRLGFDENLCRAFCFMAAMPAANLPLIQADKVGEDTRLLSKGIVLTTLCSFFTVTLFMSL